jgi:hypothetical protein
MKQLGTWAWDAWVLHLEEFWCDQVLMDLNAVRFVIWAYAPNCGTGTHIHETTTYLCQVFQLEENWCDPEQVHCIDGFQCIQDSYIALSWELPETRGLHCKEDHSTATCNERASGRKW